MRAWPHRSIVRRQCTGEGTGFKFWEASAHALYNTVGWAVSTYYDRKQHMEKMIASAMAQDFSQQHSARIYEKAYMRAIANKQAVDRP